MLYGYQEDDPVRVVLPLETGASTPREGLIVKLLPNGYFRIRLTERHELTDVIIEQIAVRQERFV